MLQGKGDDRIMSMPQSPGARSRLVSVFAQMETTDVFAIFTYLIRGLLPPDCN
jgi:hypothetical protein